MVVELKEFDRSKVDITSVLGAYSESTRLLHLRFNLADVEWAQQEVSYQHLLAPD